MSNPKRSIEQDAPRVLPKPFTRAMLEDVEGGQEGLLPVSTQGQSLKVEFDRWENTAPTPQNPEELVLQWDGVPVGTKTWTAPIASDDYYIEVDAANLTHGPHEVDYLLTLRNQFTEPSHIRLLTVDTEPPLLNANSALGFDTDTIDIDYLIAHGDVVKGRVPLSPTQSPGDVVTVTWTHLGDGSYGELTSEPLTHLDYMQSIIISFTGDFIRLLGDGQWSVTYRIQDRALNPSVVSDPVELWVAAIRAPRHAPHPWLVEIEDEPSDWGELDPLKTLRGGTLRIPAEAVYYKDDQVDILFGAPGTPGAVSLPVAPDSRDVAIDKVHIAAFLGKTLPVSYLITLADGSTHPSDPLTLVIRPIARAMFTPPQLAAPHSDPAYKSNIPAAGLPVLQRIWPYISSRCLITIIVTGTGTDNQQKTEIILPSRAVSLLETTEGVAATVSQAFMRSLKSDMRFTVLTQVSFDDGDSWFDFTELRPMLRD